ncbi:hypothetical protein U1Q18_047105 [Sarracenia purpurea var. burkii]
MEKQIGDFEASPRHEHHMFDILPSKPVLEDLELVNVEESIDEAGVMDCIVGEAGKTPLAEIGATKGEAVSEGPGSDVDAPGDFESGSSEEDGEDAESSEAGMEATEISVKGAPSLQGYKGNVVSPIIGIADSGPCNAIACIGIGLCWSTKAT